MLTRCRAEQNERAGFEFSEPGPVVEGCTSDDVAATPSPATEIPGPRAQLAAATGSLASAAPAVIGPIPDCRPADEALAELDGLVGLATVKQEVGP